MAPQKYTGSLSSKSNPTSLSNTPPSGGTRVGNSQEPSLSGGQTPFLQSAQGLSQAPQCSLLVNAFTPQQTSRGSHDDASPPIGEPPSALNVPPAPWLPLRMCQRSLQCLHLRRSRFRLRQPSPPMPRGARCAPRPRCPARQGGGAARILRLEGRRSRRLTCVPAHRSTLKSQLASSYWHVSTARGAA